MDFERENERKVERVVLAVYVVYTLGMMAMASVLGWGKWVPWMILAGMALSITVYVKKYRDYRFRALLTSGMAWMNMLVYGIHSSSYFSILSTMVCMVILLGIYCIPNIVSVAAGASTFLLFYHGFILHDIHITADGEGARMVLQILSVYVAEYVTYYLVRGQVESNRRLWQVISDLRRTERSKDDFMANVSHEIRTPINTVCGISEMILREELPLRVREDVFGIQTAGRNLLSVVSDILDFSELESGNMTLVEEPYNITSTINDIMNMALARKEGKKLELIVDCGAVMPCGMVGDEQKIRRAIMNVVDNAIKFTKEGAVILTVSTRNEAYGVNLSVTVKDTGIGIEEKNIEKLFSSFNQVDTKRNRQEGGIGLGLAITEALVGKMGGFITVKSTPGRGSEMQLVIPQKVVDRTPIISLRSPEKIRVAYYINMEKYDFAAIREGYASTIRHIAEQLQIACRPCKNLQELKRYLEKEKFSHVFISWEEYCEEKGYFEKISKEMSVVLIKERENGENPDSGMYYIYKPFSVLSIAAVLNGEHVVQSMEGGRRMDGRFIAPQASILVVDDNVMNLRVVEGLLRPYRIKVFAAGSGKEALDKIESMDFDFVFMDHMMPEMDGVETLHRIRQKPGKYFQEVPVIALTANAIGGAREMFLAEGFADFVAKPIELSVLERVLRRHIPEQKIMKVEEAQTGLEGTGSIPAYAGGWKAAGSAGAALQDKRADGGDGRNVPAGDADGGNGMGKGASAGSAGNDNERGVSSGAAADGNGYKNGKRIGKRLDGLDMEGIDVDLGMVYCGGVMRDYIDIVRIYYTSGLVKKEDIKKHYEQKDWKNYTIDVHSLKSMSMGIGAAGLSDMAKILEAAGRAKNEEYIMNHTMETLLEYERILKVIGENRVVFPDGTPEAEDTNAVPETEGTGTVPEAAGSLAAVTKEKLEEAFDRLAGRLETFESEGVFEVLDELANYQYCGESLSSVLTPVREKTQAFDFMGAEEELETGRKRLLGSPREE